MALLVAHMQMFVKIRTLCLQSFRLATLVAMLLLVAGGRIQPEPAGESYWVETFREATERGHFRVAYLGASVTCGQSATDVMTKSYGALLNAWLENKTSAEVTYTNYCLGSATSLLGLVQLKQEVVRSSPDLIISEFAILDGSETEPAVPANEAMIRLAYEKKLPYLMLAVPSAHPEKTARRHLLRLAGRYDTPLADVPGAMVASGLQWSEISNPGDQWHPNDAGHAFIAEVIESAIQRTLRTPNDYIRELPEPLSEIDYSSARLLAAQGLQYSGQEFQTCSHGVFMSTGAPLCMRGSVDSASIEFEFEGRVLSVLFKHDAVPLSFAIQIDNQPVIHRKPFVWQKDNLVATDLEPGLHRARITFFAGAGPIGLEGFLVVPGS